MKFKIRFDGRLCLLAFLSVLSPAWGQHDDNEMGAQHPPMEALAADSADRAAWGLPNGSGTSWLPAATPMHAYHLQAGSWLWMLHGSAYLRYTAQNVNNPDKRGEDALDGPNWLMAMGEIDLTPRDRLGLRAMVSLDPFTEGGDGYPQLFQIGETYQNEPLLDRQHPHELFMELAATYARSLDDAGRNSLFLYLGYPGEPALGPTAFMHRPSADLLPDAVLGHHNQDATHIVFGVATLGIILGNFKVDGSIFTGREPDEERLDFDRPRFDSYSLRLAYRLSPYISSQVSGGFINSPELLSPDENVIRLTASTIYARPLTEETDLAVSLVYGGNVGLGGDHEDLENSFLVEAEWDASHWIPYSRYEILQREAGELNLSGRENSFWIQALTVGSGLRLWRAFGMELLLGAQGTVNFTGKELEPEYGRFPLSYEVYLKLRPGRMMMPAHAHGGS